MKLGKKLLTFVAATALTVTSVFGLTACSNGNGTTTTNDSILFGKEVVAYQSQADILTNLDSGSCNLGVMDSVMAGYYAGSKPEKYTKLPYVLSEENYVVAAKKGNVQLVNELNAALVALNQNGKIGEIADLYGLNSELAVPVTVEAKPTTDTSFDAVKSKNKLVVGYTLYAPIAFEENNTLVGFDVKVPQAVAEYWNEKYGTSIEIEFIKIEWSQKETMLANGSIDLAWNGLSWTQEREDNLELSVPYMKNKQVVVCKTDDKDNFTTANEVGFSEIAIFVNKAKNAVIGVESGSNADSLMNLE